MKSFTILFSMFFFALLGQMCNGKDEKYEDEELPPDQTSSLTLKEAENKWKKFRVTADKMIIISESNLKSLDLKINNEESVNGNLQWKAFYNKSEQKFKQLKDELEYHDKEINEALKNADLQQINANKDFPQRFLLDIMELNNEMEDIIEE